MGLREPQYLALSKLHALTDDVDITTSTLRDIKAACPPGFAFDTSFPSFCFALATGVGKTLLMGACIEWMHSRFGWRNFFVITPSETIYTKTIRNFSEGDPSFVLKGTELADRVTLVTGDDYQRSGLSNLLDDDDRVNVYIFNIQKLYVSKTRSLVFHGFDELFGGSFADYLRNLTDLVLLMDESHRYRAPSSLEAITYLDPVIGLEFTATPKSQNILFAYPLGMAIGRFVKTPVVVARRGDDVLKGDLEVAKLEDGFARHEAKRLRIQAFCRNEMRDFVKPVIFVSTKTIPHAQSVAAFLRSAKFRAGHYATKVLDVHSKSEEQQVKDLLTVEAPTNAFEVVVHVNKLKEGWDVRNIWTIIPLRSSVSEILTEQTIGRGLRLPFGTLVGDDVLDSLEIISHDKYAAVIARANAFLAGIKVIGITDKDKVEEITVTVDKRLARMLEIPQLTVKADAKQAIDRLRISPTMEFKANARGKVELVGTVLGDANQVTLGGAWTPKRVGIRAAIGSAILDELQEVNARDAEKVGKLVEKFLRALPMEAQNEGILSRYAGAIVRNFSEQFRAKSKLNITVSYAEGTELGRFIPYEKVVLAVDGIQHTKKVTTDIKKVFVNGFDKSVFAGASFDSRPEKFLADVLDRDPLVEAWAKPPRGQGEIVWAGGGYNPDFWVRLKNKDTLIIEVKDDTNIAERDRIVFDKAKDTSTWCERATKASGRRFRYALVPESAVNNRTATLASVLDKAVPFGAPTDRHPVLRAAENRKPYA